MLKSPIKYQFAKLAKEKVKKRPFKKDLLDLLILCKPEWKLFISAGVFSLISGGVLMLFPKVNFILYRSNHLDNSGV